MTLSMLRRNPRSRENGIKMRNDALCAPICNVMGALRPAATRFCRAPCAERRRLVGLALSRIEAGLRERSNPSPARMAAQQLASTLVPAAAARRIARLSFGFVEIVHRSVVYGLSFRRTLRISAPRSETGGPYRLRERVFRGLEAGMKNSLRFPLGPTSLRASIESLICLRGTLLRFPGGFLRL